MIDLSPFPSPTVCYGLPLVRLNNRHAECLTSYVNRLAATHRITAVDLVRELFPLVVADKFYGRIGFDKPLGTGHTVNGVDVVAEDWTRSLSYLTGQHILRSATLLAWRDWAPPRGLLSPTRRWCSLCYQEAADKGIMTADALYWTVASVTICTEHHIALADTCPRCQRPVPWLPTQNSPGHCPRCQTALASGEVHRVTSPWEQWVAATVADLMAFPKEIKLVDHPKSLSCLIETRFGGNMAALSRAVGYPKNTVAGWVSGDHRPNIDALLRLAWLSGLGLDEWLAGEESRAPLGPLPMRSIHTRRTPHPFPHERAQAVLSLWSSSETLEPIPSARQVAEMLDVDRRQLTYKMPMSMRRLAKSRRRWQSRQRDNRQHAIRQWMARTVTRLSAQGFHPGQRIVEQLLPRTWSFRDPLVRKTWHDNTD